ncbi:hypothetical protein PR003_g20352 [Phytophthora rubi]|uniref:Uncharacterized protein n=1 Tax=Phytophthora rubi TaxID=129364 RepID=A0A6A3JPG3_9STRA|nr:hypothetical protein PR002_g19648 [Phytophthora rubi]KAE9310069.1 hypothetical protein PR003_g20352 [Phytophthora rubi]
MFTTPVSPLLVLSTVTVFPSIEENSASSTAQASSSLISCLLCAFNDCTKLSTSFCTTLSPCSSRYSYILERRQSIRTIVFTSSFTSSF